MWQRQADLYSGCQRYDTRASTTITAMSAMFFKDDAGGTDTNDKKTFCYDNISFVIFLRKFV